MLVFLCDSKYEIDSFIFFFLVRSFAGWDLGSVLETRGNAKLDNDRRGFMGHQTWTPPSALRRVSGLDGWWTGGDVIVRCTERDGEKGGMMMCFVEMPQVHRSWVVGRRLYLSPQECACRGRDSGHSRGQGNTELSATDAVCRGRPWGRDVSVAGSIPTHMKFPTYNHKRLVR